MPAGIQEHRGEPQPFRRSVTLSRSLMFRPLMGVLTACVCAAVGLFTIYGSVQMLLRIWSTDDLRSMGLAVPFVSLALILRAWRQIGWEQEGSWWGFAVLAGSATVSASCTA